MAKEVLGGLGFIVAMGIGWTTALADPTVTLSASATTVAEGGSITLTTTVVPNTYVDYVLITYEEEETEDVLTSSPYVVNHVFEIPGDDLNVTATVFYTDQTPYGRDMLDVDVVGLKITGTATPLRGWPTSYMAQSNPTGKSINQFNWSYTASSVTTNYQDNDSDDDNKSYWSGKMVIGGTLTCSATVSGVTPSQALSITISPRYWPVPITCAQDNEANWGSGITAGHALGQNRDEDGNDPTLFFVPWNENTYWNAARTLAQITSGPCTNWWYVSTSTLKCKRETVINRYIKNGGPAPSGATENFYTVNARDCEDFDSDNFVQAIENHEYRGTPATSQSWEGHQGRTEYSILTAGHDAKQGIESLAALSESSLSDAVNNAIAYYNAQVGDYVNDEEPMNEYGPNWGTEDPQALGSGGHKAWNAITESWNQYCSDSPFSF